jgi:hypothetical protein
MQNSLPITVLAAASLASVSPAAAISFPSLTTIYVGSGAFDDGGGVIEGTATAVVCSNVSGVTVSVRVLMLGFAGSIEGQGASNAPHGGMAIFTTHPIVPYNGVNLATGGFIGTINIEATNSAVFCTASLIDAGGPAESASPLRLVRVNAHPGTEE